MVAQSAAMGALGLLVLRLFLSAVLVAHGAHALFGAFAGPGVGPGGLTSASAYFAGLGLAPPFALAVTAGVIQFAGGILVGVGYFTRVSAGLVGLLELVRISVDSARWGFFLNWVLDPTRGHGMEYSLLIIGSLGCLILTGAGEWSLDGLRDRSAAALAAGRARLRERGSI